MRRLIVLLLALVASACAGEPPPAPAPAPGPDDPAAPPADRPYRPVMAGTADHGVGSRP
jgi:hypothetical protein